MDTEDNIKHRDEMLSRFRECLNRPLSERFFDEDDLIDIFDYAGDINDDYLRVEAMLCAARFYPDSVYFTERRAIFYSNFSDTVCDRFLDDSKDTDSLIMALLRIKKVALTQPDQAKVQLNKLLEKYDYFNDEEVIQIIDTAVVIGDVNWIKDNMEMLRQKVSYINILLYEVAVGANRLGDIEYSAKMLEELTEIEPYNQFFWIMLSSAYGAIDDFAKSLTAIEFALAITPDDANALFIKAKLLLEIEDNKERALECAQNAVKIDNSNFELVKFTALLYKDLGKKDKAIELMDAFYESYPDEVLSFAPEYLLFEPDTPDKVLDDFYQSNEENTQWLWISWAEQLVMAGMGTMARKVIEAYARNADVNLMTIFQIEDSFKKADFLQTLEDIGKYIKSVESFDSEFPSLLVMHVLSLIHAKQLKHAHLLIDYIKKTVTLDKCVRVSKRLESLGLLYLIDDIDKKIQDSSYSEEFWDNFDPLELWNNL